MDDSLSSLICNLMVDLVEDANQRSSLSIGYVVDEFCKLEHITLVIYRGLSSTAKFLLYEVVTKLKPDTLPLLHANLYNRADNSSLNKDFELALKQLKTLQLVLAYDNDSYLVNEYFCKNLKGYLFNFENPINEELSLQESASKNDTGRLDKERDIGFLRGYACNRWNSVLNFITQNCFQDTNGVRNDTKFSTTQDIFEILNYASIIESSNDDGHIVTENDEAFEVTSIGFNFLLMTTDDQIRYYMASYLRYIYYGVVEDCGDDAPNLDKLIGLVSFLCMIERHNEADPFNLSQTYSYVYNEHVRHFREIGLIYRKNSSSPNITFTNYAIKSFSNRHLEQDTFENEKSLMILETNLRLYLYNPTELRVALIALFSEILVRFPNLCIARITRESIQHAFELGITSKQIISFILNDMKKVSAYKMKLQPSFVAELGHHKNDEYEYDGILPPTVVDQIYIWEKERHRLKHSIGVLLDQFSDEIAYENAVRDIVAVDPSQLLYKNPKTRTLVLSTENQNLVNRFSK